MLQQNKIHRVFLKNKIDIKKDITVNKDILNHIKNVLRIKNNQEIKIFNGDGREYLADIRYIDKSLIISPQTEYRKIPKNPHEILLAQCISSSKSMDLAIQKSTELGINEIIPLVSSRSHPGEHDKKIKHWEKIIIHATEQSNGLYLPVLSKIMSFKEFIDNQEKRENYKICFNTVGRRIQNSDINHKSHLMLIGPEGGFDENELQLMKNYNWNIISLGDRIFRTETASVVAQTILRGF